MTDPLDDELHPLGRPRRAERGGRTPAPQRPSRADGVITAMAFVIAVLLGAAGGVVVLVSGFAFDACSAGGCWYAGGSIALFGYPVLALVLVGGALVASTRRRRQNRRGWPPVVLAIPAVLLAVVAAVVLITISATPR